MYTFMQHNVPKFRNLSKRIGLQTAVIIFKSILRALYTNVLFKHTKTACLKYKKIHEAIKKYTTVELLVSILWQYFVKKKKKSMTFIFYLKKILFGFYCHRLAVTKYSYYWVLTHSVLIKTCECTKGFWCNKRETDLMNIQLLLLFLINTIFKSFVPRTFIRKKTHLGH